MSNRNALFAGAGLVLGLALAWLLGPASGIAQSRVSAVAGVSIASTPQGVFVTDGVRVWECDPRPGNAHGPAEPSCSSAARLEQ